MYRVNHEVVSSILFLIVSIIALWQTRGLSEMSYVFPRTVGAILFILSAIALIFAIKKRSLGKVFEDVNERKVIVMSAAMAGYTISIALFGFFVASIVFLGYVTLFLQSDIQEKSKKTKWVHSIISSISISVIFFILFRYVFLVPLPKGIVFGG